MLKKLILLVVVLNLLGAGGIYAQEETAQVRFVQLVSRGASFRVNTETLFEDVGYSFATDYAEVAAGEVALHVLNTDAEPEMLPEKEQNATLQAGHQYSVLAVVTEVPDGTDFDIWVVDETAGFAEAGLEEGEGQAMIVHAASDRLEVTADAYVDDTLMAENMVFGDVLFWRLPLGRSQLRIETSGNETLEKELIVLPDTHYLLIGLPGGYVLPRGQSERTIMELLSLSEEYDFGLSATYAAMVSAGMETILQGDDPITVFAPSDSVMQNLPQEVVMEYSNDTERLRSLLMYHIVPGNIPPYALSNGNTTLTTLNGAALTFDFNVGPWQINGTAGVIDDIRASNGVLYTIDAFLIPPD